MQRYDISPKSDKEVLDSDGVASAFYMDIFTLHTNVYNLNIFGVKEEKDNSDIVLIKGYHRRNSEQYKIVTELDVNQLRSSEISNSSNKDILDNYYLEDGFEILRIKNLNKGLAAIKVKW